MTRAVKKPAFEVFLSLRSLASHFGRRWIVVTQRKLLERMREGFGRRMSRRTLNRHLAALERLHVINRTRRHQHKRSGALDLRATLYTFATVGNLWTKRLAPLARNPLGRLAVTKMAQSQNGSINRGEKRKANRAPRRLAPPIKRRRRRGSRVGPW